MRAYLIPVFTWTDRNNETHHGILVNRKRLMPPKLRAWEGTTLFIGGGLEAEETPIQAVIREAREEVNLNITEAALIPLGTTENETFYACYYPNIDQSFYRSIAGACTEGTIDMVLEISMVLELWASPGAERAANQALVAVKTMAKFHQNINPAV